MEKYKKNIETKIHKKNEIGIINGLWANSLGMGGIIPIQTLLYPSSTFLDLKLTGLQGDIMKESMSVAKSLAWNLTQDKIKKEWLTYFENTKFCPVVSLKEWINYAKINSGRIFKISDKSVALIIKKYALISGLDHSKYAGHSLRSGFATSTAEKGADERSIMAMTGHKTTQMVRRYIQEANLFKNNALNKIKI